MSGNLTPYNPQPAGGLGPMDGTAVDSWAPPTAPAPPSGGAAQIARYVSALRRYKWLMLFIVVLGTAIGLVATRFIVPNYEAQARIWLSSGTPMGDRDDGPITGNELLRSQAWAELMRSFRITDAVVNQLALYLTPANPRDTAVFAGFGVTPALRAGDYALQIDQSGQRYTLLNDVGDVVESGVVGGPIGQKLGFNWHPSREVLGADRTIEFTVVTPRQAAMTLVQKLNANIPTGTNFLILTLSDDSPHRASATLNAWINEFVDVAAQLKRRNLTEFANTLESQLTYAEQSLRDAESALQRFRVNTITQPTDVPVPAGIQQTTPRATDQYFADKIEAENLRRDADALRRFAAAAQRGEVSPDAMMQIPSVANNPAATGLRNAMQQLWEVQAKLNTARQFYTDDHKSVKELEQQLKQIQTQQIPASANQILAQLKLREDDLGRRTAAASQELQKIPARTIEEMRLTRQVSQAENLFTTLKSNYEQAKLAEQSAMPDISVLDTAIAPLRPTDNTAPSIVLTALAASVAVAVVIALLLDQLDRRFRYPDQVSRELGLDIIGAVPTLRRTRNGELQPEEASQVVESFRSIRLNLRHAFPGRGPVIFTVSSPGAGDGKSLIASNLAMSFAEAGYRTLLIDGDIRRGALHSAFEVEQRPGLLDFLSGEALQGEVMKPAAYENLTVIPCGTRRRRGPELLTSPVMGELLQDLRTKFDAIIIDSAPLGAGVDAYALGAATGNMLLVFRTGATDRKLAQAKLSVLDRLPVRLIGAVLNSIETDGAYQYYSYLYGYSAEEEPQLQLTSQVGQVTGRT
jgi:capsular exopolysaccharide synthesis family protein